MPETGSASWATAEEPGQGTGEEVPQKADDRRGEGPNKNAPKTAPMSLRVSSLKKLNLLSFV